MENQKKKILIVEDEKKIAQVLQHEEGGLRLRDRV